MSFRFQVAEEVSAGVRRIALEEIRRACSELEKHAADPVRSVHEFRKSCKRLRALLRLVEPVVPELRRRENAVLRELAGQLSGVRDADVMLACLEALSAEAGEDASGLRGTLENERSAQAGGGREEAVAAVLRGLREAEERVAGWDFGGAEGFALVGPGWRAAHRRARRAWREMERRPSAERSHELRKQLKTLWYEARLLRPLGWKRLRRLERALEESTEALGDAHDLELCGERLRQTAGDAGLEKLRRLADRNRRKREKRALTLCRRELEWTPDEAERRLRRAWKAWRR